MNALRKIPGLCLALACAGSLLLSGCAASKPGKAATYYAVNVPQAQVYRFGPAQPTGADAQLKQGQKVIMLRQEYGYSRVMTEDGLSGYISNDYIAPTSPPEKPRTFPGSLAWANLPPLPSRGTGMPGVSSANRAILQNDPLFGGSPLPPLPDDDGRNGNQNQKPKPGFRFNVQAPNTPPSEN